MSRNLRVGIVGATGIAGQQFVVALQSHPWFTITRLAASERSAGKPFGRALLDPKTGARRWWCADEPAANVLALPVEPGDAFDPEGLDVVFSATESDVARVQEPRFARTTAVVSTASAFRYEPDVPLLVPNVNMEHATLIGQASFDAVVSFMSLMDGPRFDLAMRETCRVLRPGGMLAFSITHPCFLTRGATWLSDEQGVKIQWMVGNYFDPAGWVERWRFTDAPQDVPEFAVPCFGRTLSEYVNTLIGTGYVLERIEEPRPSEAYCQAHPSQRGWRDHAALFLYFRATKPLASPA